MAPKATAAPNARCKQAGGLPGLCPLTPRKAPAYYVGLLKSFEPVAPPDLPSLPVALSEQRKLSHWRCSLTGQRKHALVHICNTTARTAVDRAACFIMLPFHMYCRFHGFSSTCPNSYQISKGRGTQTLNMLQPFMIQTVKQNTAPVVVTCNRSQPLLQLTGKTGLHGEQQGKPRNNTEPCAGILQEFLEQSELARRSRDPWCQTQDIFGIYT